MDDLQPFFESRESRVNRLPAEARGRFLSSATAAEAAGDKDFADRQFVSLWIAQRTGIPRKQVLDNFSGIATRFFGPGITAAGAYDRIAADYKAQGAGGQQDQGQGEKPAPGAAGAQKDQEYAPVEGFPKPGVQVLMENVSQASRAFMGGFEGFAQKTPAGMYSQGAAVTGAPSLKDPMADPEYAALWKRNQQIEDPYQFTQVFDSDEGNRRGPLTPDEEAEITKNSARMAEIVRGIDQEHKAAIAEWEKSTKGEVSKEYRRLANFWYGLSNEAPERWTVNPQFRASVFGQFMESAGSVPATAAMAVMGPGGWAGMESAFFADVESERMQKEGAAYDPQKALPANLASALPQMVMERAFGVERLMNHVLAELPKQAGRVTFGDFAKQFVRQGLAAGAEEGITEPAQGFWNDYVASLTYDQQRETLTGEAAKRRLVESVSGFALGTIFGGGVTALEAIDRNRMVKGGTDYLTTKNGQTMTPADFQVLREVKTDEEITAMAPDPETAKVLLAAANGDKGAQAEYNNRVLAAKFVKTDGMEVGGMTLGLVDNAPVLKMSDGVIVPLDMTNKEDVAFIENFKKEVVKAQAAQEVAKVREQALKDTVNYLNSRVGEGRTVVISPEERTLRDFIQEGRLTAEEAATRIGIANDVNAANLPAGVKPEDVRVLGANIGEYTAGVYQDVSTIYKGGNVLTALEEVAEGYAKKRLALGDLTVQDIEAWRQSYEKGAGKAGDTVSAIEWFSKRAVDYAVANRKAEGVPASWSGFFRTLGEHLKTVFRLAQKMKKLQRDGLLEQGFEEALRAATGLGDQTTIPEARRKRQAELESVFPPISSNELFAESAANYDRLKEQLRSEAQAADEKAARERDFIRARLEEQLQTIADNQLAGDESITMETLTPEQKWTLKAARRAREDGLKVRLSSQADRILQEEGGYEDVQAETRANDTKPWAQQMVEMEQAEPVQPSEVVEARQRAEAAANVDPEQFGPMPTVSTVDEDIYDDAAVQEDFPRIVRQGDGFVVMAPTGVEVATATTVEAAKNRALAWYENLYRGEEMAAMEEVSKLDPSVTRLLTDIRQLGGLPAISTEKIFKGELRVIADGLPTHQRLKLFRKAGLQLDALREALNERGYNYDTVTDLLDDIDSAVRMLAEKNARGYMVTFSMATGRVDPNQGDMFAGGETGGDTMFNLQGQEATDYTGIVDKQAASVEAKKKAAKDQLGLDITFATTGIPQNQIQALQAQAQRIRSKKLMATGDLLARIAAGTPIPARVKAVRRSTQASLLARLAVPVASRLDAIGQGLGIRLRRHDFDLGTRLSQDYQRVLPFAQGIEGMKDGDAALLDLALKNGDTAARDAVLNTYGLQAQFAEVLKVIDETRQRAEAAGYEVNQIADYFPRKVADLDGLMTHYYGRPESGPIEKAISEANEAAIKQGRVLTAEERMEVVNSALQGNRKGSAMPGNLKTRTTDVVTVDANAYYTDSVTALSYYLESMNAAIEKRRFFGKYSVPVAAVPGATTSRLNLEASIGGMVEDMIARGELDRQAQQEVQAILEARFNQQSSSEFIKNFKGLAYMSTMGQITSSLTQLSDLAFSLYENGVYDTLVSGTKAATGNSKLTREALGLETVAAEFRETGAMHKAVDRVFKLVGIHYLDAIGKETLSNAKLRKMQREARAGQLSQRSQDLINRVFGPAAGAQVLKDLASGNVTADVKFAVYNVLADYQPVSLSEYPEYYLRHPNGRVFYMLKTFTLKQIDAFRREAITNIVKGNAKQKAEGFRNLIHLAGLLYIIGVPVDWLKDWIMARDPQLQDIAVDNLFKLLGVNRWSLWRFRESKNPVEAALLLAAPPAPFMVYPLTDVMDSAEKISEGDDIKPGEFESWRMLPFIGAPIYWYLGGGEKKVLQRAEKRRKKNSSGESRIKR